MARVLDAALGFDSIDAGGVYLVDEQTGAVSGSAAHRDSVMSLSAKNARFRGGFSEYAGIIRSGECFHRIHRRSRVLPDPRFARRRASRSMWRDLRVMAPWRRFLESCASFNLASR